MSFLYEYDDGGRAAAGFKGSAGDCGVRAAAIATEQPYYKVYEWINEIAQAEQPIRGKRSNARTGIFRKTLNTFMEEQGFLWTPTMGIGTGCTVHLTPHELPGGRIVARVSKHFVAVVDGVVHDTYDPTRDGTRCVYGYWKKEA